MSAQNTYKAETPVEVQNILNQYTHRADKRRLRLYYGDAESGLDWLEENNCIGHIGRSMGPVHIPLLIKNTRSMGGGAILDHCVVKIQDVDTKRVLYQHPNY